MSLFFPMVIAVVVEAAPFLLLGAMVSSVLEHLVPDDFLARKLPQGAIASAMCGVFAGMLLPTCECGVVPVARRLMTKGVPPGGALAYMLAAPVVNPVVIASTALAFRGDPVMIVGRLVVVAAAAAALGIAVHGTTARELLRESAAPPPPAPSPKSSPGAKELTELMPLGMPAHEHHCHDPACGCGADHGPAGLSLPVRMGRTAALEFLDMGRFLVLGAIAAAAFKVFLPETMLMAVEDNLVLSILAMMGLAVALSVCSEADAFVAASFSTFHPAAQLAFVTVGPMVDLKLIGMFLATFRRPLVLALVITPCIVVFICCLALGLSGLGTIRGGW